MIIQTLHIIEAKDKNENGNTIGWYYECYFYSNKHKPISCKSEGFMEHSALLLDLAYRIKYDDWFDLLETNYTLEEVTKQILKAKERKKKENLQWLKEYIEKKELE